ncbi:hypothetical protein ScPMuIL_008514 [Solemya velum]
MFEISDDDDCDLLEFQVAEESRLSAAVVGENCKDGDKAPSVAALPALRGPVSEVCEVTKTHNDTYTSHSKQANPAEISAKERGIARRAGCDLSEDLAVPPARSTCNPTVGRGNVNHCTPRRSKKRKFPGPAGLLPKLSPGQGFDTVTLVQPTDTFDKQPKEDVMMLSSQTSEDVFSESPWQTLVSELADDGDYWMDKFSITSHLIKARRRMLPRGKVPLLFALIDSLEWQQTDASVTLKDKSGKMQGTVHRDILREYEEEFQVGSAVILKQVGVISPMNRSYYLNITLSNVVNIYQNKSKRTSDRPLRSILQEVERDADNRTPIRHSPHSSMHQQHPGNSVGGTPVSSRLNPNVQHHSNSVGGTPDSSRLNLNNQHPSNSVCGTPVSSRLNPNVQHPGSTVGGTPVSSRLNPNVQHPSNSVGRTPVSSRLNPNIQHTGNSVGGTAVSSRLNLNNQHPDNSVCGTPVSSRLNPNVQHPGSTVGGTPVSSRLNPNVQHPSNSVGRTPVSSRLNPNIQHAGNSVGGTLVSSQLSSNIQHQSAFDPRIIGSFDSPFEGKNSQFSTSTPKQLIGNTVGPSLQHKTNLNDAVDNHDVHKHLIVSSASQTYQKRLEQKSSTVNIVSRSLNQIQTSRGSNIESLSCSNTPRNLRTDGNVSSESRRNTQHSNSEHSPAVKNYCSKFINSNSNNGIVPFGNSSSRLDSSNKNTHSPSLSGTTDITVAPAEGTWSPQITGSTNIDLNVKNSPLNKSDDGKQTRRSFSFKPVVKSPIIQSFEKIHPQTTKTTTAGICTDSRFHSNVLTQTIGSCENISTSNTSSSFKKKTDMFFSTERQEVRNNYGNVLQSSHQESNIVSSVIGSGRPTSKPVSTKNDSHQKGVRGLPWLSGSNNCDPLWQDDLSDELLSQLSDEML